MKKIILFINCFIAAVLANAQSSTFEWAKNIGGLSHDQGNSITVDEAGNIYTTGYFELTCDFDPGPGIFNMTSAGSTDIFVLKLNAAGNFIWAKQLGGSLPDVGNSIAIDAFGNVYSTGKFRGIADFNPGAGTFNLTSPFDSDDIFISKLDASGNFIWAKRIGENSPDAGNSITVDGSGNVYTTGYFQTTVDFDPGPGTFILNSGGAREIFVSKLDASGNFLWAKNMGGVEFGNSIAVDVSGNVYTTGHFTGTADFDPGTGTYSLTALDWDVFISKLNASGNFVWAKQLGGPTFDKGNSIAIDGSGNVYATGFFGGTADFDPGPGTFNLTSAGIDDIFISKLDASGNLVWAKDMGGTLHDFSASIAVDATGNVYTTGYFQGTADFDPAAGIYNLTSAGNYDIFILKLDASGNLTWVKKMGGTLEDDGYSIALDISGNIYTSGIFNETVDFDPDADTTYLNAYGNADMFIHKMSQCTPPSALITAGGPTTFCSGGSVNLNANSGAVTYQWKNNGTDISGATNSIYTASAAGSYSVVITNSCGSATSSATTVAVNSLPSATITPTGSTTFCSGGSVVLNAPTGANKAYQWKKNNVNISGATLSSFTATALGNYKVTVTNTLTGCSKTTGSATVVTVNAKPAATITPQGPTTFCAGGSVVLAANTGAGLTYKWKKGGNFISGATLSNYTAAIAGIYKVEVTNSNGCAKLSTGVTVTIPCREGEILSVNSLDVKVFPNPNAGEFTVQFSNKPAEPVQIEITDEMGRVVKRFETNDETVVIKESNLAKGIYCLAVINNKEMVIKRINVVK